MAKSGSLYGGGSEHDTMVPGSDDSVDTHNADNDQEDDIFEASEDEQVAQVEVDNGAVSSSASSEPAQGAQHPAAVSNPPPPATGNASVSASSVQNSAYAATFSNHSAPPAPSPARRGHGPIVGGQQARDRNEVLSVHLTDTGMVRVRYRIQIPGINEWFEQIDDIPVLDPNAVSPADVKFYFLRDPQAAKIPKKIRGNKANNHQPPLWVRRPGTNTWMRSVVPGEPDEEWELVIVFRRFNTVTHRYEEAYVNPSKLINVDPNDKNFMYAYNKWIDQFCRRNLDTGPTIRKDHWTVPERCALMKAINEFCARQGLKNFGTAKGMSNADLQLMADAVNAVGPNGKGVEKGTTARGADATRAQIMSAHDKKNKAIFVLREKAETLRNHLAIGEIISRRERYPMDAIPEEQFPIEGKTTTRKAGRGKGPGRPRKSKPEETVVNREQSLTPPLSRRIPGADLKLLELGGTGLRPNHPDRIQTTVVYGEMPSDWETEEEASSVEDSDKEDITEIGADIFEQQDNESSWSTTDTDIDVGPDTVGIEPSSSDESDDRDDDTDFDSGAPPGPTTAAGGAPSAPAAPVDRPSTPTGGKRSHPDDDEDEGGMGDHEAPMSPPQRKKTKKPRMSPPS
ncbi:hypothetical protein EK21DRAFT_83429 [Setomelanomma holmii]|uniref:Uncharacterized protein n=1 Tax=Setomelanomma holmii TaxID=210430 RepID=A0A9P4HMW3_9PLEO|nr:hypothetical protein EK21DRAFT_83429 [Setomelanomma holmii]